MASSQPPPRQKPATAANHRFSRLGQPLPAVKEFSEISFDIGLLRHFLDIGPGGECLVAAGDDDAADSLIILESRQCLIQFGDQRRVERVQRLGPVERYQPHGPTDFNQDVFVKHRARSYFWQAGQ